MTRSYIKINNASASYINHGTTFSFEYSFPETIKKVLIFYRQPIKFQNYHSARSSKPGSLVFWNFYKWIKFFRITKAKSSIRLVANYYFPEVKIYLVKSFWPLKLTKMIIPLKIDFVNSVHPIFTLGGNNKYASPKLKFPLTKFNIALNRDLRKFDILEQTLSITNLNPRIIGTKLETNKKKLRYD